MNHLFWLLLVLVILTFLLLQRHAAIARASAAKQTADPEKEPSALRPIDRDEEAYLRNCFPWTVYYLQNLEYRPQAVICRGQLRTNPEAAYQRIRENVEARFGNRFLVVFQESLSGKPFFALVPNPYTRREIKRQTEPLTRPRLALGLLVLTLVTTTLAGAQLASIFGQGTQPSFELGAEFEKLASIFSEGTQPSIALLDIGNALQADLRVLLAGLPYALALIAILGIHELAHYLVTQFYKIRATLPYFMPIPFVPGTIGAYIRICAPVPHRKALFDIGIAGPLAGLIVTLPVLIWGLLNSEVVGAPTNETGFLDFDTVNPRISILLALLSKLTLGSQLQPESFLNLHPVAVAGLLGLVVTALNLMPIGQLDGGHVVHAMFGQRAGVAIGQVTRLLVLVMSLIQPYLLFWAIVLILFIPVADEPALNDVSELDNGRDFLGLVALALLLLIVLPTPSPILSWLNL